MTQTLKGKTIFMSGGSRGIGLAIAKRAAADGANVAIAAKTAEPHPKLPGTIYTAAEEIEAAGGKALPIICDIRNDAMVEEAVDKAASHFGGIDICINNASAIQLTPVEFTDMKRYDLMNGVNARGTYLVSKMCLPHLKKSEHAHILNLSPPLIMTEKWFQNHTAYTMAKYGMSMCVLGMAGEFKKYGIAVNALWPLTAIDTAAVRNVLGGDAMAKVSRDPAILADAAHLILTKRSDFTGNFVVDDPFLREHGYTDEQMAAYAPGYDGPLAPDFFLPEDLLASTQTNLMKNEAYED
jgi:citronellol/citronellal dehydrogenase